MEGHNSVLENVPKVKKTKNTSSLPIILTTSIASAKRKGRVEEVHEGHIKFLLLKVKKHYQFILTTGIASPEREVTTFCFMPCLWGEGSGFHLDSYFHSHS